MICHAVPRIPAGLLASDLDRDFVIASTKADVRRQWVIRTTLALLFTSTVLILLVLLRADQTAKDSVMRSLDRPLNALQADVNILGQLPAALPAESRSRIAYASTLIREYAKNTEGPVIVASTPLAQPVLRGNGCGAIIYENRQLRRVWLSQQEYETKCQQQEAAIKAWNDQRHAVQPVLP